jgi:1-acyl-sn-glycerol-3-phosphate acyltransferase
LRAGPEGRPARTRATRATRSTAVALARHLGRGLFHALAELGSARRAPPRDARDACHRLAGALGALGRAHDLAVSVRGDVPRGNALVVANHVSYLDPIAILPVCPAVPIAKGEVAGWPIIGPIGAALGVLFVDRDDGCGRARALRRIHDLLAGGTPVLNFPEGTTTRGDEVLPFWRGSFGVAQRLGVPIVPLAIRYADPEIAWFGGQTFVPHYLRTAARARVEIELSFGAPLRVRAGEPAELVAARARRAICQLLQPQRFHDAGSRPELSPPRSDSVLPPPVGPRADGSGRRRAARRAA